MRNVRWIPRKESEMKRYLYKISIFRSRYLGRDFNGPSPPKENPESAYTARAQAPPLPSGGGGVLVYGRRKNESGPTGLWMDSPERARYITMTTATTQKIRLSNYTHEQRVNALARVEAKLATITVKDQIEYHMLSRTCLICLSFTWLLILTTSHERV